MGRRSLAPSILVCVAVAFFSAANAHAMTVVPVSTGDLAVSSRAIVAGRIVDVETAWHAERGAVYSYVTLDVERVLKGDVPPGLVVLRQRGGQTDDHVTWVDGAPDLRRGHRALFFLNTDREGALRVAHLSLGHFAVETDPVTGAERAVRAVLGDDLPLADLEAEITVEIARRESDVARFEAELHGGPLLIAPPEYVASAGTGGPRPSFTFIQPGFRWFEPDSGGIVSFTVAGRGPTPSQGVDEAKRAFEAWSTVTGSNLRLAYSGRSSGGGHRADGRNAIAFGDPLDEIDPPVNCTGVVASGGISASLPDTKTIGGKRFVRIGEGDVVVNDGFDCFIGNTVVLSEVLTHEMGHALGFGHSSERISETNPRLKDATMFFAIHNDNRGALLRSDDSEAARFLYPGQASAGALSLETAALPDATPNAIYDADLEAQGGRTPYVWTVVSGSLPSGIVLTQEGRVVGTPTAIATSTLVVRVRDDAGRELTQVLDLRVTNAPAPFLLRGQYDDASGRLVLYGLNLDASATLTVDGAPFDVRAKYSDRRGRLTLRGTSERLRFRPGQPHTVVVTIDGQQSNPLTF
jgi:hypothetical protein